MKKHGLLRGHKFNMRHSTVIPDAVEFVRRAKALPTVTKISIGVITPCGPGTTRMKLTAAQHAVKAIIRGSAAVQTFYLYGDVSAIIAALR